MMLGWGVLTVVRMVLFVSNVCLVTALDVWDSQLGPCCWYLGLSGGVDSGGTAMRVLHSSS